MDRLITLLKSFALPDLTPGYLREFHREVLEAVADGKLTEEEIAFLEKRKEELGLTDEALAAVRQDMYAAAFASVKEDEEVTDDEWDELENIQDYLGLMDKEVEKSKKELYRMRILSELKKGNLPVVRTDEVIPEGDELIHWLEAVDVYEPVDATGKAGGKTMDLAGWSKADTGSLIATDKRIVVKGTKETHTFRLSRVVSVDCYINGITLHLNARKPLFLRYKMPGNHNVAGSVLVAVVARSKA